MLDTIIVGGGMAGMTAALYCLRNNKKVLVICILNEIKSLILLQTNKVMEDINRIKVVLVEKKRTNKWLAEQLGVNPSTVSKWCTNSSQPDLNSLLKISDLLGVDIKELIVREYKQYLMSQGV